MKVRISRGGGFRGLLNYVLDDEGRASGRKRAELIDSNQPGTVSRELAAVFCAYQRLRPDVKRPVWHASLRLPAGERLSSNRWRDATTQFMQKLGFSELTPYVVVRHNDHEEGDHVHIVLSRVNLRGEVWLGQHDVPRAIAVTQQLERDLGLTRTRGHRQHSQKLGDAEPGQEARHADSRAVINANRDRGQPRIDAVATTKLLLECASKSFDLDSFISAAASCGITVSPSRRSVSGEVLGLAVVPRGRKRHLALSRVTKNRLSWPKLQITWRQQAVSAVLAAGTLEGIVEWPKDTRDTRGSDTEGSPGNLDLSADERGTRDFGEETDDFSEEEQFQRPRVRG